MGIQCHYWLTMEGPSLGKRTNEFFLSIFSLFVTSLESFLSEHVFMPYENRAKDNIDETNNLSMLFF